jgi:hypothetical protein
VLGDEPLGMLVDLMGPADLLVHEASQGLVDCYEQGVSPPFSNSSGDSTM